MNREKIRGFKISINMQRSCLTLLSVEKFKKCPKNEIGAIIRKDKKITATIDNKKYTAGASLINGKISLKIDGKKYTKLKEDFIDILHGAKYESDNTGDDSKTDTGGDKKRSTSPDIGKNKGKGSKSTTTSVLDSSGRDKPSKSDRPGSNSDTLAPKSN